MTAVWPPHDTSAETDPRLAIRHSNRIRIKKKEIIVDGVRALSGSGLFLFDHEISGAGGLQAVCDGNGESAALTRIAASKKGAPFQVAEARDSDRSSGST